MDLKEFVSETISQIIDGFVEAKERTKGKNVSIGGSKEIESQQKVSFDVAITVVEETETTGKAGISVWSIGTCISGKSENTSSTVSRIKFDVPIYLSSS